VDLPDANQALRRMELALQLRQPSLVLDEERELIAGYNRDDCVSTLRLRDWLEVVRRDAEAKGIPCPRPPFEPDQPEYRRRRSVVASRAPAGKVCRDGS
jgi:uncharacterized protein